MTSHARLLPLAIAALTLTLPGGASADYPHVVGTGESLSSVAAADGLTVAQLAAANGLSTASPLQSGATLMIPPQGGTSGTATTLAGGSSAASGDGDAHSDDPTATATAPASASVSPAGGSYVVQPGDSLSAIAARAGVSVAELAAANGLAPSGVLLAGHALRLSAASSPTTQPQPSSKVGPGTTSGQPIGAAAEGFASGGPYPTPERVSAAQVGRIADAGGVPSSLADAIGWQESGFNNDLVSSADARGVMQILPGTWNWIQQTLSVGRPLAPASAADNVRGGVLLLHSLLSSAGGDPALAAAAYYQGLASVRAHGMYSDTQAYVNSVLSLTRRFGGG